MSQQDKLSHDLLAELWNLAGHCDRLEAAHVHKDKALALMKASNETLKGTAERLMAQMGDLADALEKAQSENRAYRAKDLPTGDTFMHVKRGTVYQTLGVAYVQRAKHHSVEDGDRMVIYRGANGMTWVRPIEEFHDGRFVAHPPSTDVGT